MGIFNLRAHHPEKPIEEEKTVNPMSEEGLLRDKENGVVKSYKVYTAEDGMVCPACEGWNQKVILIQNAKLGVTLPKYHFCQNIKRNAMCGCRCYFRPEEISSN